MSANWGSAFFNTTGNRTSSEENFRPESVDDEVVEPDQGNGSSSLSVVALGLLFYSIDANKLKRAVLSHIISQLRPGADLSRVVLPTFILEPRSMLERITKYVGTYYDCNRYEHTC